MEPKFYCAEPFTARRSPGYLLRRAHQLITPRAEAVFADRDLTLSQWIALKLVGDRLAESSGAIARMLGHNSGATTRMVDQLEARGLLCRQRQGDDRRLITLALTGQGRDAVAAMHPGMVAMWEELLADFTHAEVEIFIGLLTRLVDRLEAGEDKN